MAYAPNFVLGVAFLLGCAAFNPVASFSLNTNTRQALFPKLTSFGAAQIPNAVHSLNAVRGQGGITNGDTVLIVGGTGGVGQLVTKKLRSRGRGESYNIRATSRNANRGRETIDDDGVEVVTLDLVGGLSSDDDDDDALDAALRGVSAVVISLGTTAFPTKRWAGGNNPKAVDDVAVTRVARAAARVEGMKKVILLTSVGVDRTGEMPFVILNLFGVLDAKKAGEEAVAAAAKEGGFDYAIVRPGRLVGGPYTNLDVAKLLKVEGGAENGVTVEAGDSLLGDCKRDACAECVVQCLENAECRGLAFSVISNEEKALTDEQWTSEFVRMQNV